MFFIKKYDLAIIGGGPIGLYAATFAQLHGLKVILFEALKDLGGQPKQLYSFKNIYDVPTYNQISGGDLINRLKNSDNQNLTIIKSCRISAIQKNIDHFLINNAYLAKAVILATGIGTFEPKKLPIQLSPESEKKIHYYIKDPKSFANQKIGILGGGDSALDWALELSKKSKIKIIHRRKQFRGLESSITKLKKLKNVQILTPYLPKDITLIDNQLNVVLKEIGKADTIQERFDQLVVAYGFKTDSSLAKNCGLELTAGHIKVNSAMQTSLPGIYAVGDAISYPNRVPVIGLGFGEAQIAITAIMRNLFPEKTLTIHSSSI